MSGSIRLASGAAISRVYSGELWRIISCPPAWRHSHRCSTDPMLLSLSIRWLCWRLGTIGAKQLKGLVVVNNYYYEALVACTSAVYPLLWGQCPRTFWWSHALNNPQSKYFTAKYAHSDLLMATCWARAGPYINTCCYISIICDQSHWRMKILIYLLQSLFYLTKSLLKCIALFGNMPYLETSLNSGKKRCERLSSAI